MRVRLRKLHPCGGDEWSVVRTGADVGLTCARCGRRIMLEREEFERRIVEVVLIPAQGDGSPSLPASSSGDAE
jgi:hypothetical protein